MADETQQNEVATYAAAVRSALADLAEPEREALLEDLEDHLAEVLAESDATLASRLGPPEAYAAELRAAYGVEMRGPRGRFTRIRNWAGAAYSHVSGWSAYQVVRGYLPELRPAWWVLRAYLAVLALAVIFRGDQDIHPIPNPFTSGGLVETIAMAVAIVYSIKLGRWASRRSDPRSWPLRAGNAVVGLGGLIALGSMSTLPAWVASNSSTGPLPDALAAGPTTNIYPYSSDGKPLDGVLLYDQDGRPVTVSGNGYDVITQYPLASDGQSVMNEYPLSQTTVEGNRVAPPRVAIPPLPSSPSPSPSPSATPSGNH